ncbi:MAG: VOC family protein [Acidobacteria bacterium]|nr:VOC family protein [Acidobacteriota bacterium]
MSTPDRTPSLFTSLHHVSLVVENLDDTLHLLARLGFGPFVDYPPLTDYVRLEVPDVAAFHNLRIKVCQMGPVALQIIEGKDGTVYGEFLRSKGQGIFHLGFQVDDIGNAEQRLRDQGLQVLSSGRRADGSGFTYIDSESELGVALLLRQNPPSPAD